MLPVIPYKAPKFSLPDESGNLRSLTEYLGKWTIVYFYPKDGTPGCTDEALALRDARDELSALGAEIVGISRDGADSHEKFMAEHKLPFHLLTDADTRVMREYGVWGKKPFGREGTLRQTFIINPAGQVVKVFSCVTPRGHGTQVIDVIKELQGRP